MMAAASMLTLCTTSLSWIVLVAFYKSDSDCRYEGGCAPSVEGWAGLVTKDGIAEVVCGF